VGQISGSLPLLQELPDLTPHLDAMRGMKKEEREALVRANPHWLVAGMCIKK
jgi:hypothetical protein